MCSSHSMPSVAHRRTQCSQLSCCRACGVWGAGCGMRDAGLWPRAWPMIAHNGIMAPVVLSHLNHRRDARGERAPRRQVFVALARAEGCRRFEHDHAARPLRIAPGKAGRKKKREVACCRPASFVHPSQYFFRRRFGVWFGRRPVTQVRSRRCRPQARRSRGRPTTCR